VRCGVRGRGARGNMRPPVATCDRPGPRRTLGAVSTRMLIVLALICGLALVVAFAIQAQQIL
jgi:hypothetical protein